MTFFEVYLFVLFPAFLVAAFGLSQVIRTRVRRHHPETWERLERPGPLSFEKFNAFLAERKFGPLADNRLTSLCIAMIWLRRAFLIAGSIWLISITYRRPVILGAIVLLLILTTVLNRYAQRRRKRAV